MPEFAPRLDQMITQHCKEFSELYGELCESLFQTDHMKSGGRFHQGAFGSLREYTCERLLQPFTPRRFKLRSGFVVSPNATDAPPKQCDLLICDRDATPFIESMELGPFFPVEAIAAIGEVKSRLYVSSGKPRFEDAIIQVSEQIKQLVSSCEDLKASALWGAPAEIGTGSSFLEITDVAPKLGKMRFDDFFSFLICQSLSPGETAQTDVWQEAVSTVKENDVYWPDAILSIRDGLLLRNRNVNESGSPEQPSETVAVLNADKSLSHIKCFLAVYHGHLSRWTQRTLALERYLRFDLKDIFASTTPEQK